MPGGACMTCGGGGACAEARAGAETVSAIAMETACFMIILRSRPHADAGEADHPRRAGRAALPAVARIHRDVRADGPAADEAGRALAPAGAPEADHARE